MINVTKQRRKRIFFRFFLILTILVTSMVKKNFAAAASATVGFEVSEPNIFVGDQFTISLTIDTDNYLGDFEGNISYDSSLIKYLSGPSCVAGGDGLLRIKDIDASSSWNARSYVLTFEAIGVGNCELSLVGTPVAYDYESQEPMSLSSTSKVVQVSAPKIASSNAELADLKIRPSSLTPSFDSTVTEYSTIVDSTTTRLILSAIAQDSNAKVEIEGNQDFIIGNNDVKVIVVSEAGAKKEYTIHVEKEDEALLTVTPDVGKEEQYSIHASLVDGLTILADSYAYTVVISEEGIEVPKGYEKTNIKIDGYTIPVYQLSGNVEDDYLLLILQNQFGQTNLYRYDRIEKTIQRYTGDRVIIQNNLDNSELELINQKKEYEHQLGQKNLLVVVLAGFSVVLLIGIISLFLKTRYHDDDL